MPKDKAPCCSREAFYLWRRRPHSPTHFRVQYNRPSGTCLEPHCGVSEAKSNESLYNCLKTSIGAAATTDCARFCVDFIIGPPLTLDSTGPLAGDTLLVAPGRPDPEARAWFAQTINTLCNHPTIAFSRPPGVVEKPIPLLYAWRTASARITPPSTQRVLSNKEKLSMYPQLASKFVNFVRQDHRRVKSWLEYQLFEDIYADVFWGGGNTVEELIAALRYLCTDTSGIASLLSIDIDRIAKRTCDEAYQKLELSKVPAAYAFFAFAKGAFYGQTADSYFVHWMRELALDKEQPERPYRPFWYLWGDIFLQLLEKTSWHPDPVGFSEGLVSLRDETLSFNPAIVLSTAIEGGEEKDINAALLKVDDWAAKQLEHENFRGVSALQSPSHVVDAAIALISGCTGIAAVSICEALFGPLMEPTKREVMLGTAITTALVLKTPVRSGTKIGITAGRPNRWQQMRHVNYSRAYCRSAEH